jgi:hypothetical protein
MKSKAHEHAQFFNDHCKMTVLASCILSSRFTKTLLSCFKGLALSAQVVWLIVGWEILNGDVDGDFQGIQIFTSGVFQLQ